MSRPEFVYEIVIRASAADVWAGITDPAFTRRYFHGTAMQADWVPGGALAMVHADGRNAVEGEVIEVVPQQRLVHTWRFTFDPEMAAEAPSRLTWELDEQDGVTRLRVTHEDFPEGSRTLPMITEGWAPILCSLKTLLETGDPLPVAGAGAADGAAA